jgi:hypothetical protein
MKNRTALRIKLNWSATSAFLFFTYFFVYPIVTTAQQEIGHYAAGVLSIRDFSMPAPGFYGVLYNYGYYSKRLNDADGNQISDVTIHSRTGQTVTLNAKVNVDVYVLAPTFIWISKWKILGANYGAFISPSFSNTSVGGSLASLTGSGRSANQSQFSSGDLFVQPLWLGWTSPHWNFALGYGFYAPIGKYEVETYNVPVIGPKNVESSDNIGLGFWTNQLQGAASWYPWTDQRMDVTTALTYEMHGQKKDFDLKPGQNLSLNWGVSQYLPLQKDQVLLLEVGLTGYSTWQISDDSGEDAIKPTKRDQVQAVGGQLGLTQVKWNASLNFHYFYEFAARDRFQGESVGLNLAIKF